MDSDEFSREGLGTADQLRHTTRTSGEGGAELVLGQLLETLWQVAHRDIEDAALRNTDIIGESLYNWRI